MLELSPGRLRGTAGRVRHALAEASSYLFTYVCIYDTLRAIRRYRGERALCKMMETASRTFVGVLDGDDVLVRDCT